MAIEAVQKIQGLAGFGVVPPKAGDKLATGVKLKEHSPTVANVDIDNLPGRNVIVGIPGAFTPTCSCQIPSYVKDLKKFIAKGIKGVYVVMVNDQFVTEAWKEKLGAEEETKLHFLADDTGEFTAAIGMGCDSRSLLGGLRSERYAMIVQDGVIEYIESEPDIDKTTVTKSETLLEKL